MDKRKKDGVSLIPRGASAASPRRRVGDDPVEIDVLERAILDRLDEAGVREPADDAFVRYRFGNQLRNYWSWNGLYALAFVAVTIGAVVTNLTSSSIAAGWSGRDWARWTILLLGVIGAIAGLINWSWKPGHKAISRTRGRNALRAEGWAFVQSRGRYSGIVDVREAFGLFVDEVDSIAKIAAEVDERGPEGLLGPESELRRDAAGDVLTLSPRVVDRRAALRASAGSLTGVYQPGELDRLRDEWR